MTVLLSFNKFTFWHFGRWSEKVWLLATPIFGIVVYRGDLIEDSAEVAFALDMEADGK